MKSLTRILEDAVREGFRRALAPLDCRAIAEPGAPGHDGKRPRPSEGGLGDCPTTLP